MLHGMLKWGQRCGSGLTPQAAYAALLLGFGLLWVFLVPPFQTQDEYDHFHRAFSLTEGQWTLDAIPGDAGGMLPRSFKTLAAAVSPNGLEHNLRASIDWRTIVAAWRIPLQPDDRVFISYWQTTAYTPVPYLPQILGIGLGRILHAPPLGLLYLGRLANLLAAVLLGVWGIRAAGRHGWMLAQVGLLPMAVSVAASLSADVMFLGMTFGFLGVLLGMAEGLRLATARQFTLLAGLFVGISLCKAYVALWGVVLAFPYCRLPRRHLTILAAGLGLGFASTAGWGFAVRHLDLCLLPGHDPLQQAVHALGHPWLFARMLLRDLTPTWGDVRELIGVLGWLNLIFPAGLYVAYLMLLAACAFGSGGALPVGWGGRATLLLVVLLLHADIHARQYLLFTPVGSGQVLGVQGRYFLPYLPVLLLIPVSPLWATFQAHWQRTRPGLMPLANFILLAFASVRIAQRFYLP